MTTEQMKKEFGKVGVLFGGRSAEREVSVSYTHLTLPTIYSV